MDSFYLKANSSCQCKWGLWCNCECMHVYWCWSWCLIEWWWWWSCHIQCLLKLTFRSKSDLFLVPLFLSAALSALPEKINHSLRSIDYLQLHLPVQKFSRYLWCHLIPAPVSAVSHLDEDHQNPCSSTADQGAQTSVDTHSNISSWVCGCVCVCEISIIGRSVFFIFPLKLLLARGDLLMRTINPGLYIVPSRFHWKHFSPT